MREEKEEFNDTTINASQSKSLKSVLVQNNLSNIVKSQNKLVLLKKDYRPLRRTPFDKQLFKVFKLRGATE